MKLVLSVCNLTLFLIVPIVVLLKIVGFESYVFCLKFMLSESDADVFYKTKYDDKRYGFELVFLRTWC